MRLAKLKILELTGLGAELVFVPKWIGIGLDSFSPVHEAVEMLSRPDSATGSFKLSEQNRFVDVLNENTRAPVGGFDPPSRGLGGGGAAGAARLHNM